MKPIVHGLEAEYWGKIDFVYIDIDNPNNQDVLKRYGFTAQPLFILIDPDGNEVKRWFGFTSDGDLRQAFNDYLASGG